MESISSTESDEKIADEISDEMPDEISDENPEEISDKSPEESPEEIADEISEEDEPEHPGKWRKRLRTITNVLIVVALIAAVYIYVVWDNEDEPDRITAAAGDAAEEFLNGEFQSYLDDIISKCGLSDLTAEVTVDYDSIQKLTLSIAFNVNVSFFSDEIDDYYCESGSADEVRIEELRSVMHSFSEEAGKLDHEDFEFAASSEDYVRLHLYVDYNRIKTSAGRVYYYTDSPSYEELTINGTEILYNEYPAVSGS